MMNSDNGFNDKENQVVEVLLPDSSSSSSGELGGADGMLNRKVAALEVKHRDLVENMSNDDLYLILGICGKEPRTIHDATRAYYLEMLWQTMAEDEETTLATILSLRRTARSPLTSESLASDTTFSEAGSIDNGSYYDDNWYNERDEVGSTSSTVSVDSLEEDGVGHSLFLGDGIDGSLSLEDSINMIVRPSANIRRRRLTRSREDFMRDFSDAEEDLYTEDDDDNLEIACSINHFVIFLIVVAVITAILLSRFESYTKLL